MQGMPAARGRGGSRGRPRRRFPAEVLSSGEVMRLIGAVARPPATAARNRAIIVLAYRSGLPAADPEQFEYDADGNLTLDGVWVYEWDAENRLKAMWMRPEVAAIRLSSSYWVRLEFSYDYLGRRIAKKFLKGDGDTSWSVEKASQSMIWADNKIEKFAYDGWMRYSSRLGAPTVPIRSALGRRLHRVDGQVHKRPQSNRSDGASNEARTTKSYSRYRL